MKIDYFFWRKKMKTQTIAEDSALTSLIFWCIFNGWLVFFVSLENNSLKKIFF